MEVKFFKSAHKDKLLDFANESFPERGDLNQKLVNFRYFNPLNTGTFIENSIIAYDDAENIVGQALYHPTKYFFNGEFTDMEWGFDLFVKTDNRVAYVGIHIMEFIKANKLKPTFATGVGPKALKMKKFYGYHVIGHLEKYYKLVNPLFLLSGILRGKHIASTKFPKVIGNGASKFEKVNVDQLPDFGKPFNENLLEFGRTAQFMKWRYFSKDFDYAMYKSVSAEPTYFVVRTTKIKGITVLLLVDYRFNVATGSDFSRIIDICHKIAAKLLLPIVVTASSHHVPDEILALRKYKKTGMPRPIVCNVTEYKSFKERIVQRDFVLLTFADSDGEYLL